MAEENRLAKEKSPYLLQHARNPVDWHPWGDEAVEKAKREDKPIFLSIGYSTCHWCHVMEHESFEDEKIAELLNRDFVSIKVDREERPDVDKIYMTAVQALTGQGGWPLSVFLTPSLKPFFGGTYFPPAPRYGQPGFAALLSRIAQLWKERRQDIDSDAGKLTEALAQYAAVKPSAQAPKKEWLERAAQGYAASFDPEHGGFGGAPKFPMPVSQAFLLRWHAMTGDKQALEAAAATLRAISSGGIRDHLGGGFHRYSTDAQWRVPHFEKMLYDNAQLSVNLLEACQALRSDEFKVVARQAIDYVLRDLRAPEGGFSSAEDADSAQEGGKKEEGAFYLWTKAELSKLLGEDAELFGLRYGIEEQGNAVFDPHGELAGKNVLYEAMTVEAAAQKLGLSVADAEKRLKDCGAQLWKARAKRARPDRDDKILTSWNGLMISALSKGWQVLQEPTYLTAAQQAASFIKTKLWDEESGQLWRSYLGGRGPRATADDYAFLLLGLLDLFEAGFDPGWLEWALTLAKKLREGFEAPEGGFYLTAEGQDEKLILRMMDDTDNVEPSASSVAALAFLRLSELTGDHQWREAADKTIARFGEAMRERPQAVPFMLCAAIFALSKPQQVVVAGKGPQVKEMLSELWSRLPAARTTALVQEQSREKLVKLMPWTKDMAAKDGAAAYVCEGFSCQQPVTDAKALAELL